jgi:predicted Zn-dependent peptidase
MILYNQFSLPNGLKVIVHEDNSTPLVTINTLYMVGARDEFSTQTGFAHLFEHLMFGGSKNIENFDTPLEYAGGENNAFTTNDITNYYITLPANNIETALWLESDRMLALDINQDTLDNQKNVVFEEFKETCINLPYGDLWHYLSALAYIVHPYQWPTIGKEISHIENATLRDVRNFYQRYYCPNNAVLVIAGGVQTATIETLVNKWFGDIPRGEKIIRNIPKEPMQTTARFLEVIADVPVSCLYKTYSMCRRIDAQYYATDMLSDILGSGDSSRLFQKLVKETNLCSAVNAFVTGSIDEGLFIIDAKLNKGVTFQEVEIIIQAEIDKLCAFGVTERELQKVKNQIESYNEYNDLDILNRATNLAFYSYLGDIDLINNELKLFMDVSKETILLQSRALFREEHSCTLYYKSKE